MHSNMRCFKSVEESSKDSLSADKYLYELFLILSIRKKEIFQASVDLKGYADGKISRMHCRWVT